MTDPRPAPYPADTRSKGWRFELDLERVMQSDTWALALPEERPWLYMIWATAWMQVPCGSLPNDDRLIAARLGMPMDSFLQAKQTLMRGWWLADDGRLYHDTVVSRVVDMLARKDGDRKRKADYRARMDAARKSAESASVPPLSRGTDGGRTPDSSGSDDTGTSTGTRTITGIQEPDDYHVPGGGAVDPVAGFTPTPAGEVCMRLRSVGIGRVNPSHPRLKALLDAGATVDEFLGFADAAMTKDDPFAYLLTVLERERTRAAATGGSIHKGALPKVSKQGLRERRNAQVVAELVGEIHAGE